jgi:phosphotransferase system enzyme I (PtsI)
MSDQRLDGIGVTPLSGVGPIWWFDAGIDLPPETGDHEPADQRERYEAARETVDATLADKRDAVADRIGEDEAAVFDAHRQFLTDPEIEERIEARIEDGAAAEHAVDEAYAAGIERLEGMDGMMAERADDLRDVRDRLLRALLGEQDDRDAIPDGAVVAAERLTPSETAGLDPDRIAGIVTVTGGSTGHAAIIARSMGLPAVVGIGEELSAVEAGTRVLVDGDSGVVVVDPEQSEIEAAETRETVPPITERVETADGTEIEVAANVGGATEAEAAAARGADGVGLFRTEFLFQERPAPPDEDEQRTAYEAAMNVFDRGDRVIVRTLDVGGDKPIPYLDLDSEENGFMGARGIRLSLQEHADLFETQLSALLRAAASDEGASLAVMFPMVTTAGEIDAALNRVDAVASGLSDRGVPHERPEIGVMVETPAAADIAGVLADRVDFLSIGTNDLSGYVMAARRDIERVADLHDPLHPGVLRAIERTVRLGHEGDAWVGMCGEMAGDPRLTGLLVGLGLDELSASAISVPRLKRRVREIDTVEARELAERALDAATRAEVESLLDEASNRTG